jgi:rare lipoprotein A
MRRLAVLLLSTALAACGTVPRGGYYLDDGPDATPVDVSKVPDAVPKPEPRAASGNNPYNALGERYVPMTEARGYRERGIASWYGKKFHGKPTSSREPYDMYAMSAAHKTLPLPSYVRVRNLQNGRSAIVRVNDRGPFLHNRLIDLSYAAAHRLGIVGTGTGLVEIETVEPNESAPVQLAEQPATEPRRPTFAVISPAMAEGRPLNAPPRLYLQLGAFASRDNAEKLRAHAERAALGTALVQAGTGSGGAALYRVRIGPLASVEDGDRLTTQARALGFERAHIVVE